MLMRSKFDFVLRVSESIQELPGKVIKNYTMNNINTDKIKLVIPEFVLYEFYVWHINRSPLILIEFYFLYSKFFFIFICKPCKKMESY